MTISPGSTSFKYSAPIGANAHVSEAMMYPPFNFAIESGRMPQWSRTAMSVSRDIMRMENAPVMSG